MLTWAGFAPLKPLPPDIHLKDPELDVRPIQGIWMQRSLYKWTNITGMSPSQLAPLSPPPVSATIPDAAPVSSSPPPPPRRAEIEWKPLPGTDPEILRDPAPMPGVVLPEVPKPLRVSSTTATPPSAPVTPHSEQKQTPIGTASAKQANEQPQLQPQQQPIQTQKQKQKGGVQAQAQAQAPPPPPAQSKPQGQGQQKQKQKGGVQTQPQAQVQSQAQKQQPKPKPPTQRTNANPNTNPNQKPKQKPKPSQKPKATPIKPEKVEAPTGIAGKLKGLIGGWW